MAGARAWELDRREAAPRRGGDRKEVEEGKEKEEAEIEILFYTYGIIDILGTTTARNYQYPAPTVPLS